MAVISEDRSASIPAPRVSFVMPIWNAGRFLREALESLLAQTFSDFEIIVVDDGSTDDSHDIALAMAADDGRIRLLRLSRVGIAAALNTGLSMARGEYIARMDGDDVALPERLQKQIDYLDQHPSCVVVGSDVDVMDSDGNSIGHLGMPHAHDEICSKLIAGYGGAFIHPSATIRRNAIVGAGGYDARTSPSEDRDLWVRLMHVGQLANLPEVLLRYRRHENSIGARELDGQRRASTDIVNTARRQQGLRLLRPRNPRSASTPISAYHAECARIALQCGNRWLTLRHAGASISASPFWLQPYASLAACILPTQAVRTLMKARGWLRTLRLPGISQR